MLEDSNPTLDKFDVHFPHALAMATEILPNRFDAIVVDEAQDFGEEYWFPIELLLRELGIVAACSSLSSPTTIKPFIDASEPFPSRKRLSFSRVTAGTLVSFTRPGTLTTEANQLIPLLSKARRFKSSTQRPVAARLSDYTATCSLCFKLRKSDRSA